MISQFQTDNLPFNTASSHIMHIDLNSCFATIEQQANPLLRNKPVAVAAYTTPNGCIIAPSIEAKRLGIKVGMRVKDGKSLCPNLIIISPDPWKYRFVNRKLLLLLQEYSPKICVKSIDEMVLDFGGSDFFPNRMIEAAQEIKYRIKKRIGSWLTVSIGIAPNRFLAKTSSGLHKPDGLDEINRYNFQKIYSGMPVKNLCGIKINNKIRLNSVGVFTTDDMYHASIQRLKSAFCSIASYYWYLRLRGYEIDDIKPKRQSFGQSYALYHFTNDLPTLSRLLCKLVEKMGKRLRNGGYTARGVHLTLEYDNFSLWHHGETFPQKMYASGDLYKTALRILLSSPLLKKVRTISVSCFHLDRNPQIQLYFFSNEAEKRSLTSALDTINNRFGQFTVFPATMMGTEDKIPDRIAFGGIRELEEFVFQEQITSEIDDYFTSNVPSSVQ